MEFLNKICLSEQNLVIRVPLADKSENRWTKTLAAVPHLDFVVCSVQQMYKRSTFVEQLFCWDLLVGDAEVVVVMEQGESFSFLRTSFNRTLFLLKFFVCMC